VEGVYLVPLTLVSGSWGQPELTLQVDWLFAGSGLSGVLPFQSFERSTGHWFYSGTWPVFESSRCKTKKNQSGWYLKAYKFTEKLTADRISLTPFWLNYL